MRTINLILEMLFWMFAAAVAIFAAGTVIGLVFNPFVGYLAGLAMIGFIPLGVRAVRALRRRRAAMAVGYLEQAVRLNLPLGRMLGSAQRSERGALQERLMQLRLLIESGYPVGLAMESALPEISDREASIVTSAERVGRLPHGLARLMNEYRQASRRQSTADVAFYRAYPLVMLAVLGSAMSLFAVFVLPKYNAIFRDFGTSMPPLTQYTFRAASTVGPALLVLVVLGVLVSSGTSLWQAIHPVRLGQSILRRVRDRLAWWMPILHGIERDRGLADVFELLSDALSAGVSADMALLEAGGLGVNSVLRDRVRHWAERVHEGDSIADAARKASMPAIVVGMIGSARDAGAIVDVCGFLARYYRTRFSRTAAIVQGTSIPVIVMIFGLLVACAALAMFLPMISLIQNMSSGGKKWVL